MSFFYSLKTTAIGFFISVFIFSGSILAGADEKYGVKDIKIVNGWSPAAPSVAPTRVGYFSILNGSDKTITIIGASSPHFGMASFHETRIVDGVSRMSAVEKMTLKPMQEVILEPSGIHLMLMNIKEKTLSADSIPVVLALDSGEKIHIELMVKTAVSKSMGSHSSHAHH